MVEILNPSTQHWEPLADANATPYSRWLFKLVIPGLPFESDIDSLDGRIFRIDGLDSMKALGTRLEFDDLGANLTMMVLMK